MIIADNQEELDKIPCPQCKQHALKMGVISCSCPMQFTARCDSCGYEAKSEGQPIKILKGEDSVRSRPHLYLEHDNPVWRKLAKECLASDNEDVDDN